jgi:hypothetical protein
MKPLITAVSLALLSTTEAKAAGPYDGIWYLIYGGQFVGYYSVHERDGTAVAVGLEGNNNTWEAYIGVRTGSSVTMSTIVGGVALQSVVTFTSDTTLTARQLSCVPTLPGWQCLLPNGATAQGHKIW